MILAYNIIKWARLSLAIIDMLLISLTFFLAAALFAIYFTMNMKLYFDSLTSGIGTYHTLSARLIFSSFASEPRHAPTKNARASPALRQLVHGSILCGARCFTLQQERTLCPRAGFSSLRHLFTLARHAFDNITAGAPV